MSDSNVSPASPRSRRYIVVVHGIGEQKLNQTTTPVIHRFAEIRQNKTRGHFKNLLPSYLSAQSVRQGRKGHGWSEFTGIPVDPKRPTGGFDGTPATDSSGLNFRFVDLHWQHILQRHQELYSSPAEKWAPALLARTEDPNMTPRGWIPSWTLPLLRSIVHVALPVKKTIAVRYSGISRRVFDDFLGDVDLYGDYSRTRGKAVRHFHVILDEIMLRDFIDWCRRDWERRDREGRGAEPRPYEPPEFTVMAHSLGSIMSFDALVYAHAEARVRGAQGAEWNSCPSLPFLGYTYRAEAEKPSWEYIAGELEKLKASGELDLYKENFSQPIDDLYRHDARGLRTVGRLEEDTELFLARARRCRGDCFVRLLYRHDAVRSVPVCDVQVFPIVDSLWAEFFQCGGSDDGRPLTVRNFGWRQAEDR